MALFGDFNEIMYDHEKQGGNVRRDREMRDFRECLERCGLRNLGFVGHNFTWSNKQSGDGNIQERLDRAVATDSWGTRFTTARVTHLTSLLSDHCPLWVEMRLVQRRGRNGKHRKWEN